MTGWDDAPAAATDDGWQGDAAAGGNGGFAAEDDVSKHADGECYNCGEMGHNKASCENARVEREFTGTCRFCDQSGHRAAQCPEKPAETCRICKQEGHIASDCGANRMIASFAEMGVKEMSAEDAWKLIEDADKDKDVHDIKQALLTYAKAYPEVTFEELEQVFRDAEMNTYLIAKQQDVSDTHTIVNLQGKQDQEYVVSIQFSAKPRRAKFAEGWPETPEENSVRLAKAGVPMDRMVPKCSNCDQLGHGSRTCPEEKMEKEKPTITCANCNNEGHRARDCAEPRKSNKRECKNCGKEGHLAKDCEEERVMKCRNCDELGHAARDCSEPKNMAKVQCRNCDEFGHTSRECTLATDWSRVECSNCKEKGHSYKRCKALPADSAEGGDADAGGGGGDGGWGGAASGGGGSEWNDGAAAANGDEAAATTGGGGW